MSIGESTELCIRITSYFLILLDNFGKAAESFVLLWLCLTHSDNRTTCSLLPIVSCCLSVLAKTLVTYVQTRLPFDCFKCMRFPESTHTFSIEHTVHVWLLVDRSLPSFQFYSLFVPHSLTIHLPKVELRTSHMGSLLYYSFTHLDNSIRFKLPLVCVLERERSIFQKYSSRRDEQTLCVCVFRRVESLLLACSFCSIVSRDECKQWTKRVKRTKDDKELNERTQQKVQRKVHNERSKAFRVFW